MIIGTLCFEIIPGPMLSVFSRDAKVIEIGVNAFHIIGMSFILLVTSLTFPGVRREAHLGGQGLRGRPDP